jgi:hypothetical protein
VNSKVAAWAGLALLIVTHLDFWRPQRPELYFGWMPEDLVYRLLWMLAAWVYLLFFTRKVWGQGTLEEDD